MDFYRYVINLYAIIRQDACKHIFNYIKLIIFV